jgi:FlaA1/EpsC-like NDP-sugar epimerase
MLRKFILRNSDRFLSRWIVLLFDLFIVLGAYLISVVLRFNFEYTHIPEGLVLEKMPLIGGAYLIGFALSRSHVGVIRHTGVSDALNIFKGTFIAVIIIGSLSTLSLYFFKENLDYLYIANSILLIHFLLSIVVLIGTRFMVKLLYNRFQSSQEVKATRVMIYGAGASGIITKNTLQHDTSREYDIVNFIDDNPSKIGKSIEGIPIIGNTKAFSKAHIEKHKIAQVIISIQSALPGARRNQIVDQCLQQNLQVKVVPPVSNWIQGELSTKQIKAVRIEDLLEREPIMLDSENVSRELKGKRVLVTGAAGSIGSEIVRQCLHYNPEQVILLDQAESALYELELELKSKFKSFNDLASCVIGDVRDYRRMRRIYDVFKPDIVFHAAAYKHVPLMEDNPYEAVGVNILGTKNIADLAVEFKAEKFVMVSTDKAVNPTNVMGATKRTAELYTQSLGKQTDCQTQFITTRFGNVLGSNGSVIPVFRKQIAKGGPITVTHRDITRFFMTIPEACNLVLEAGSMGKGGEIFVFDMGESVKIYDLAKKMVKLSGLELGKDIEIVEVGLRPGEKLYEELLAGKENTLPTHHKKIMIAQTQTLKYSQLLMSLDRLQTAHKGNDNLNLVSSLKAIVPEYISKNSIFESLDLQTSAQ